jgi:hypothetical protein
LVKTELYFLKSNIHIHNTQHLQSIQINSNQMSIEDFILDECQKRNIELNIIGIVGKKNSGKTVVANYLTTQYVYTVYNYADKLKDICKTLFNFTDEQCEGRTLKEQNDSFWKLSPRIAFQRIGTEFGQHILPTLFPQMRNIGDRIWIESLLQQIYRKHILLYKSQHKLPINIVIADVRFEHEIESMIKLNARFIYVQDPFDVNDTVTNTHTSEMCGMEMIKKYETTINETGGQLLYLTNNKQLGLPKLYAQIDNFMIYTSINVNLT